MNGITAKASTRVKVGDHVDARLDHRDRVVEVARLIEKRVGAAVAAECLVDHSPALPPRTDRVATPFARDPGAGRPTKRDRRTLDRLRDAEH